PQDGLCTAAFAGLIGRLLGVRVVCIDQGDLSIGRSNTCCDKQLRILEGRSWLRRAGGRILLACYRVSLMLMIRIVTRTVDHFCVPGKVGDGTEELYASFGVGPERLTRFGNALD